MTMSCVVYVNLCFAKLVLLFFFEERRECIIIYVYLSGREKINPFFYLSINHLKSVL